MDQISPEEQKPNLFDLMPDPYSDREEFNKWFDNLLSQIDNYPNGYVDKRKPDGSSYSKVELVDFFRRQLRDDVAFWTSPRRHPRDPNKQIPPTPTDKIREALQDATTGLLRENSF